MQSFYNQGADKVMIIKPNTLIEAGFDLTEAEHDLITLAVNKLHRLQSGGRRVLISAKEFANANRVNEIYAYRALKDTAKILGDRKLKFTLYLDKTIQATNEADKLTVIKPNHNNLPRCVLNITGYKGSRIKMIKALLFWIFPTVTLP